LKDETTNCNMAEVIICDAGIADIDTIIDLACQIWPLTYGHLMPPEKLQYMLRLMYSADALRNQMEQGHMFLLATIDKEPVGFASFSTTKQESIYKLHKIYVRTDIQGKGIGKALLNAVIAGVRSFNATSLQLNVKRDNTAKDFYEKAGFTVTREEDIDIGNGYFMNDYVMEKQL